VVLGAGAGADPDGVLRVALVDLRVGASGMESSASSVCLLVFALLLTSSSESTTAVRRVARRVGLPDMAVEREGVCAGCWDDTSGSQDYGN
jgi:hypothetical protein